MTQDIFELSAIFLGLSALGVGLIWVCLGLFKRKQSPFVKITDDTVKIFRHNGRLISLPFFSVVFVGVVAYGVFQAGTWMSQFIQSPNLYSNIVLAVAGLGSVAASCLLVLSNAPLIEYVIALSEGAPESLLRAIGRAFQHLISLLAFTFLWSLLLVFILMIMSNLKRFLLALRLGWLAVMVDFAEAALEMGMTMAAYFMLVVMIREKVTPWNALIITLEITKEEFAKTFSEIMIIEGIDVAVFLFSAAFFVGWIFLLVMTPMQRLYAHLSPLGSFTLIMGVPAGFTLMLVFSDFAVFQTLQIMLAASVYLYLKDGILMAGFSKDDFDHVLGLRACGLRTIPRLMALLGSA